MDIRTKPWRLLMLVVALAMVAAACAPGDDDEPTDPATPDVTDTPDVTETTDGDTDEVETVEGGTVVWGYDQEPLVLNPTTTDGNMFATSQIALATLLPLWIITPDFEYTESPLLESAETSGGEEGDDEPFSVTYQLAEDATWSDGEPITAGDVFFTIQTCLNEEWDITSRAGCDEVDMEATEAELDPDSKEFRMIFAEPYAPWQTMFSTGSGVILPQHVLEGEDWNTVWNEEIPIASGPFIFDSWEEGQQLTIVRNENYFGDAAHLDSIVFRFLPDSDTQVQQLRGGEIDLFYPQPQLDLVQQVEGIEGIRSEASAGPIWEHLDFQHTRPPLDQQYVRQAIAMAIDRDEFIEQFILPLNPDAEALNSIVYVNNQPEYEDHYGDLVEGTPEDAAALLEENGCTRGDDDIFVCEGERLSWEWETTAGNERRELFFEIAQQSLREAGIEVTAGFQEPAALFAADNLAAGEWDVINFAWVGSPDPAANVELWKCEGAQNYHGHCPDDELNELLESTNRLVDPDERASAMNEAGRRLAEDLVVLPLYQFPTYLAWNGNVVTGLQDNATQWGPVWNIGEWRAVAGG